MSRDDGFAVMDVSTSWLLDDKFSRLAREYPGLHLWGTSAYAATMATSWRHGKRMKVTDSLPSWLRYDPDGVGALMAVRLLDRTGRIPIKPWREWFEKAVARREKSRERYARWAEKGRRPRTGTNGLQTVGKRAPSVRPSVRPSESPQGSNETVSNDRAGDNGRPALRLVEPLGVTA